jgi:hypothetical protein
MSKSGYPKHDALRLKAEKAFGAAELRACDKPARPSDFYGSKIHVRRVKKNMGGSMPSAGILGLPGYIMDAVNNVVKSHLKHGGKVCRKPVKRSMGGPMSFSGIKIQQSALGSNPTSQPFVCSLSVKSTSSVIALGFHNPASITVTFLNAQIAPDTVNSFP